MNYIYIKFIIEITTIILITLYFKKDLNNNNLENKIHK